MKSASSITSGGHSGCAMICRLGSLSRYTRNSSAGEALVHLAAALPGDDLHLGLRGDVAREIFVGQEDHFVRAEALDHLHGVRRRAADVALRLHVGGGVDVGHDRHAGKTLAQQAHVVAGDGGGERAAGAQIRDQHGLVGIEDLRGLGHEMHAALHDDVGVDLAGLARKLQRVADEIGDAIVDFRRLVIVREDDGVALFLQRVDRLHIGRKDRPFDRRHDGLDALVKVRGLARDVLVPVERRHRLDAEFARGGRRRCGAGAARGGRLTTGPWVSRSGMVASPNMLNVSIYGDENIRLKRAGLRVVILTTSKSDIALPKLSRQPFQSYRPAAGQPCRTDRSHHQVSFWRLLTKPYGARLETGCSRALAVTN